MKTAVVFKWIRDPQDARVSASGEVTWPGVKFSPTDDDPAAIAVAKAISAEEDIVGITIGDGKPEWAAARGAASTIIVEDAFGGSDGTAAAAAIAAAVKQAGVDVVAIGDSEWDRGMVAALIGELGWSAYAGVVAAEAAGDAIKVSVKGQGGNTIIEAHTPVILAAQALEEEKDAPGMKQTLAARKKPVEKTTLGALGASGEGKSTSEGTRKPDGDAAIMFDATDPAAAVNQLVDALRGDGIL
ncbi:MAG: hypothetical protein ACOYIP_02890 [Coriobacteriales bacterium]|jgi:electron transfer flavoprotein beta subunit